MSMPVNKNLNNKLISVIMPCFNSEKYLQEAIDSVLSQTYPYVELIVIDDGSTDGSKKILSGYGDRIVVIKQNNQGPYPARNRGIKASKGKFITFLDADDYWRSDCLEKLYLAVIGSNADLVYCGWQNIGKGAPGGQPYVPQRYEDGDAVISFLKSCPWPIHAVLIQKRIIDKLGGFSERYFSSMDYDLWLRLLTLNPVMFQTPEVLAFYRWHDDGQISSVQWRQVFDAWNVRREFIKSNPSMTAHLNKKTLRELTDGLLLSSGYKAYWRRDLETAQKIFRTVLIRGDWSLQDCKYLIASLLPQKIYRSLIQFID